MDKKTIEKTMTVEKVETLIIALEIIVNGDLINVGFDEIAQVAQNALDYFEDGEYKTI